MKIKNSVQSKNLSKIQKIFANGEQHIVSHQVAPGCTRLHQVDLESPREQTKLYHDVLQQIWKRIFEQ